MTAKNAILIKIVLLLFVIISIVNIIVNQVNYNKQSAALEAANAEKAAAEQKVNALKDKVENGAVDDMIEEALRERGFEMCIRDRFKPTYCHSFQAI